MRSGAARMTDGGALVAISSIAGGVYGWEEHAHYAAAKAGLHRLTQGLAAEVLDDGIAVNAVGPSTAIMTPGAAALLPDGYETEPVEYLVQTVLEMSTAPASECTGLVAFSLHYPYATNTPVMSLDGRTELPRREPPTWANPNIRPEGI